MDKAHAFTFVGGIVGVKILSDGFDEVAILLFLAHLFMSEHAVVREVAIDFSVPQAERVDSLIMIPHNRHIIGHRHDNHSVFVHQLQRAVGLLLHVRVAIELNIDSFIGLAVLPRETLSPVPNNTN